MEGHQRLRQHLRPIEDRSHSYNVSLGAGFNTHIGLHLGGVVFIHNLRGHSDVHPLLCLL